MMKKPCTFLAASLTEATLASEVAACHAMAVAGDFVLEGLLKWE